MPTLAYYVSGHGFGHARRSAQVLRTLAALRPDLRMVVRTAAPAALFKDIPNTTVSPPERSFDPGAIEKHILAIDVAASLQRLAEVLQHRDELVRAEADFLRRIGAQFVVADIPFLAGDAAQAAGIPCLAVGNFTWDWIFEAYAETPAEREMVEQVRQSYRKMDGLLQPPLRHDVVSFRDVIAVPLLAVHRRQDRAATLGQLGIDPADPRPRILIAMRGGLSPDTLRRAAQQSQTMLFLVNQPIPDAPANLRSLDPALPPDFTELIAVCDAVVSKLGYGILSDCIANQVAILYPPRTGFREDEIAREVCPQYLRMHEIPSAAFANGDWGSHLLELLHQPAPPARLDATGDRVIAEQIVQRLKP